MADKDLFRFLQDADDIVKLVTGKRIPDLVTRGVELFGGEAGKKLIPRRAKPEPGSPYAVLEVRPDASDLVIRATYKALLKETKDPEKLKKIRDAYEQIKLLREW